MRDARVETVRPSLSVVHQYHVYKPDVHVPELKPMVFERTLLQHRHRLDLDHEIRVRETADADGGTGR